MNGQLMLFLLVAVINCNYVTRVLTETVDPVSRLLANSTEPLSRLLADSTEPLVSGYLNSTEEDGKQNYCAPAPLQGLPGVTTLVYPSNPEEEIDLESYSELFKCLPFPEIVPFPPHPENKIYEIPAVRIDRCSASCCVDQILHKCTSVKEEPIKYLVPVKNGESEVVTLNRHTECKWECRKSASDCKSFERFDVHSCSCVCKDEDRLNCMKRKNYRFNEATCQCECSKLCAEPWVLNIKECKCKRAQRNGGNFANRRNQVRRPTEVILPNVAPASSGGADYYQPY